MSKTLLTSVITSYKKARQLDSELSDDVVFEYLSATCIAEKYRMHGDSTGVFSTGDSYGVDAVVIAVNNTVIQTSDELLELQRQSLTADIHIVQCKNSNSFARADLLKFEDAISAMFADRTPEGGNWYAAECVQIITTLYSRPELFLTLPKLHLHFAFGGSETDLNPGIKDLGLEIVARFQQKALYCDVGLEIMDWERLLGSYREITTSIERTILASKRLSLPSAEGVVQAFVAVLPWTEYRKLVTDSSGKPIGFLFDDNVRDFQGFNSVNKEIATTLTPESGLQDKFAILNNGVTIVADRLQATGDSLTIGGYQIVNGCQTTNVLCSFDAQLTADVHIPVKIIEVKSRDVTNRIIRASNRQTEVKDEAFVALDEFHRKLEQFFENTPPSYLRLYYERRSKQHVGNSEAAPPLIVTLPALVKQFVSIFLDEPYKTHHYYGELLHQVHVRAFQPGHSRWPYYTSAVISMYVANYFNRPGGNKVPSEFKPHVAWLVRYLAGGDFKEKLLLNDAGSEQYCRKVLDIVHKREVRQGFLELAVDVVSEVLKDQGSRDRNISRSKSFFDHVKARVERETRN